MMSLKNIVIKFELYVPTRLSPKPSLMDISGLNERRG